MPSKKIFIYIIICASAVISVWLLTRKVNTAEQAVTKLRENSIIVEKPEIIESSDDWKKILTKVSTSTKTFVDVTKKQSFDSTTLTAQMSKDFLSQYLLLKKGGRDITIEQAQKIADNVMTVPEYTNSTGARYISSNLHITKKSDKETLNTYKITVNYILRNRSLQVKEGPVAIVTSAMQKESQTEISKLDPIILTAKSMITDLLSVEVPESGVNVHLDLVNSVSSLEANIEAMRSSLSDPVKAMAGVSSYNQNILNFTSALKNMNLYFIAKTGSQ